MVSEGPVMASECLKLLVPGPGTPWPHLARGLMARDSSFLSSPHVLRKLAYADLSCLVRSWPDGTEGLGPPRGTGTVSIKPCPSDAK